MSKLMPVLLLSTALMGCSVSTQTTYGRDYLDKYNNVALTKSTPDSAATLNQKIREAAAIEPVLKFPARIGIARIDHGDMSLIPQEEGAAWRDMVEKLGSDFGTLVPISPMLAEMSEDSRSLSKSNDSKLDVVNKIRLGAARQHVDAVLIYEVNANINKEPNILALGNLTIIGGFILPSQSMESEGHANAVFMDVVQGYPYGTAQTIVEKEKTYGSLWGWGSHTQEDLDAIKAKASLQLIQEVKTMLTQLHKELTHRTGSKVSQ